MQTVLIIDDEQDLCRGARDGASKGEVFRGLRI